MCEHLYIHVPFCLKKCRYCDFYSITDMGQTAAYGDALVREIAMRRQHQGRLDTCVKTVYFGGGTPSVLPLAQIETVLDALVRYYSLDEACEITLEANPGTLDKTFLDGLYKLGVNRLSLGVQSFDPDRLDLLGRIHTQDQAVLAIEAAAQAGFGNIGLDLIYGLPGQTEQDVIKELDRALAFAPSHLSCYMLTLEPGTPLYHLYETGRFVPMAGPCQVDLFSVVSRYLENRGFMHYEISNFAIGDQQKSRHNRAYWRMVPYAGFGPSAHSYRIEPGAGPTGPRHIRFWNHCDLNAYVQSVSRGCLPVADQEILSLEQQMLERIMVGLRTADGVDIPAFDGIGDLSFTDQFKNLTAGLVRDGFGCFSTDGNRFWLTRSGWARLDNVVERFARHLP